jgi:hypothetical protein
MVFKSGLEISRRPLSVPNYMRGKAPEGKGTQPGELNYGCGGVSKMGEWVSTAEV